LVTKTQFSSSARNQNLPKPFRNKLQEEKENGKAAFELSTNTIQSKAKKVQKCPKH
jgi:hypothetical protein